MSVKTFSKDLGKMRLKRQMKLLERGSVTIGVHKDAGNYPDGASVAEVAFWNEFGTRKIPERSFMRSTMHEKKGAIQAKINQQINKVAAGETTAKKALNAVGFSVTTLVMNKIKTAMSWAEKLSEPYGSQREKAFPGSGKKPLNRTRKLLNSITWKAKLR